jgi:hypothetical protein
MLRRMRLSPAMVVASIALFISLTGAAIGASVAAVPLAKRALSADVAKNAKKLQGKTAAQVADMASPATSAAGLVSVRTSAWALPSGVASDFIATCDSGQKAVGGGWDQPNPATLGIWAFDSRPTSDGTGWRQFLWNISAGAKSGTVYAVCLK